jgi:hypothetical protein
VRLTYPIAISNRSPESHQRDRVVRWWFPLLAIPLVAIIAIDAYLVARHVAHLVLAWYGAAFDWRNLAEAASLPNPYEQEWYRWSPVAAWLLQPATAAGLFVWRLAHVAAVLTLRDWRAIALVLLSAPFWSDMQGGNALIFVAVAAWHAVGGSRIGMVLFLALTMLMPRPLMLPVLAWLLWHRPESRPWFVVIVATHAVAVLGSGLAGEWTARLLASSADEFDHVTNIAPSQWIGWAWVPIGLALSTWLTLRGNLGLASIAISPYFFQAYLLMLVLELRPRRPIPLRTDELSILMASTVAQLRNRARSPTVAAASGPEWCGITIAREPGGQALGQINGVVLPAVMGIDLEHARHPQAGHRCLEGRDVIAVVDGDDRLGERRRE